MMMMSTQTLNNEQKDEDSLTNPEVKATVNPPIIPP